MKRKMYSSCEKCNANCIYCFAKWDNYIPQENLTFDSIQGIELIYPSCDSEFLNDKKNILNVERLLDEQLKGIKILNISTKFSINENIIKELEQLNEKLISRHSGFVKIGVSFSNAFQIDVIERGTCSLDKRVENLKMLSKYNIPRIAIIKPILPFVDVKEYIKIIDLTKAYVDIYLIGDLYVKVGTDFYDNYIKEKYNYHKRNVSWLNLSTEWDVVEMVEMKNRIKNYIVQSGKTVYETDVDCSEYYIDKLFVSKE